MTKPESPMERAAREMLEHKCRTLAYSVTRKLPKGVGMCLFLYDFGPEGALAYMSNGNRADVIKMLEEFLAKQKD